ncbi:MAG: hypothetical protein LLF75_10605 [Eubacteriales bacterium]|nr:hypothetical protein [Eubacteriales bacterium]
MNRCKLFIGKQPAAAHKVGLGKETRSVKERTDRPSFVHPDIWFTNEEIQSAEAPV